LRSISLIHSIIRENVELLTPTYLTPLTSTSIPTVSTSVSTAVNSPIEYPFGTQPVSAGLAQRIAPGVYWVRMPLPFALDHINLWLIEDCIEGVQGWTLIDCGIDSKITRDLWEQIFSQHLNNKPLLRIIATHMHPDHLGNAHWICERFKLNLWMSGTEFYAAHHALNGDTGFGGTLVSEFMESHGLRNEEWLSTIRNRSNTYSSMVPKVPERFIQLKHNQFIDIGGHQWQCIEGFGHSPEHIALYSSDLDLLISGDMLLPKISTNVSVWASAPESNPVHDFLESLTYFEKLPAQTTVCPSHGIPFLGIGRRVNELRDHHADRLDEVLQACRRAPQCAHDVIKLMFKRDLDLHQITFAMGEALAHLHWWWHKGEVKRFQCEDQIIRFGH